MSPMNRFILTFAIVASPVASAQSTFMLNLPEELKKPIVQPAADSPRIPPLQAQSGLSENRRSSGPGGTMQDCGIEPGPVAYNIGNSNGTGVGRDCRPRSVVVGFNGSFSSLPSGTIGMGYINPRLENKSMVKKFPGKTRVIGDEWDEPVFLNYGSKAAVKYIAYQVKHWKDQGDARGQSCVAVDVDNCDVIGTDNYGKVLDTIDRLNRERPKPQIRVLVKNPQNGGCGKHLKRSVAVGAFMEELSTKSAQKLSSLRANPNQILVFARGNNRGKNSISMNKLDRLEIPNSTVSHDSNGSYKSVSKCTYHPGGTQSVPPGALVGEGQISR